MQLRSFDGAFHPRPIRGSNPPTPSNHSFGGALDFDARYNPYRRNVHNIDLNFVMVMEQYGFSWGGRWALEYIDSMHFEFVLPFKGVNWNIRPVHQPPLPYIQWPNRPRPAMAAEPAHLHVSDPAEPFGEASVEPVHFQVIDRAESPLHLAYNHDLLFTEFELDSVLELDTAELQPLEIEHTEA